MEARKSVNVYSRIEWKKRYDELLNALKQVDNNDVKHEINDKIIQLEAITQYDDFYHHPRRLLEVFISELQQLLTTFDKTYLINQSDILRLLMLKMRLSMTTIQHQNRQLVDLKGANKQFQDVYLELCKELAYYAAKLRYQYERIYNKQWFTTIFCIVGSGGDAPYRHQPSLDVIFYRQLQAILSKHEIALPNMPATDLPPTTDEIDWLHKSEKKQYQRSLHQLNNTMTALPVTMQSIKKDSNVLINKIESNRLTSQNKSCLPQKLFDYKRHTINLNQTNALLKSPCDTQLHHEYKELIESNSKDHSFIGMSLVLMGALIFSMGIVLASSALGGIGIPIALAIFAGLCFAGGGTIIGVGIGNTIKSTLTFFKNPKNNMSKLLTDIKNTPQISNESMPALS